MMTKERDDNFTKLAAQVSMDRRKKRRRLIIILVVVLLMITNLIAALQTGVPTITLCSSSWSGSSDFRYSKTQSLGFTVYRYQTTFADYISVRPWFFQEPLPLALSQDLYESLLDALNSQEDDGYSPPESKYLETKYFAGLHIYEIAEEAGSVKIYGYLRDGAFAVYDGAAYEVTGSSMPVVITAGLNGKDVKSSTEITGIEIWRPKDGDYYAPSIKEAFPKRSAASAIRGAGTDDAAQKQKMEVAASLGVPVSDDLLMLDADTGKLEIVRCWDEIDEDGNYRFQSEVIEHATLQERS